MNIKERFQKIFAGEQAMGEVEQDVLQDMMRCMLEDRQLGLVEDVIQVWACKLHGVVEFMKACGKINEDQEEDLCMMVNEIESVKYE